MTLPTRIEAVVLPILDRYETDLVLGTFRREKSGQVLRLLIERRGSDPATGSGVDVFLCAAVSRDVGAALDVEETFLDAYTLEVSSAGIERPLVRLEDFERFAGRKATIKTRRAIEGRKKLTGVLDDPRGEEIVITLGGGKSISVPYEAVAKAHLVFEMNKGR
jgi:ribosome maturation factor RimP